MGGLADAGYPLAFYASMNLAGVAIGSVISLASAPLFSGVLELVIDRRRPGGRWAASAALGLVAGATYALYSWAARRLMADSVDRSAAMGVMACIAGALLILTLRRPGPSAPGAAGGRGPAVPPL